MKDDAQACDRILQGDIELYHFFPVIRALYERGPLDVPSLESLLDSKDLVEVGEVKQILEELERRDLVMHDLSSYQLKPAYRAWIDGIL